jgi:ABC-type branched-subunit amino acid transport system ATPase component
VGDDFYMFDAGRTVHYGQMKDLMDDEALKTKYLGISSKG